MRNGKKIIAKSLALVFSMLSLGLTPIDIKAENALSYTMYENTFDTGHKSLVSASAAGYSYENDFLIYDGVDKYLGDIETTTYIPKGQTKENTAIRVGREDWCGAKTFLFDFTKGGSKEGIKSGTVRVSFDYALDSESTADASRIGMNLPMDASPSGGGRMMYFTRLANEDKTTRGYAYQISESIGAYPGGEEITEDDLLAQHHFEVVMDFDNNVVTYLVDGEALTKTQNLTGRVMNNFMIGIGGIFKYFDNLKVVHEFKQPLECVIDSEFSETNPGNVFFGKETAKVNLHIKNQDRNSGYTDVPIKITVTNSKDEVAETHTVNVNVGAFGETDIEVPLKLSRYDAYRISVTSEKSLETKARTSRVVENNKLNPKTGVHMQVNGGKSKDIETVFHFLEKAGLGNVRTDLGWSILENEDGTYSHGISGESYIDRAVSESKKTGVEILGLLSTSAQNTYYPGNDDGGFNNTENYLKGFHDYCYSVASKYGDTIKSWEIGNEDNYTRRYKKDENGEFLYNDAGEHITEHDLGENYAPILLNGYKGIKEASPDSTVMNAGSAVFMDNEGNNQPQFAHGWLRVAEEDSENTYFDDFAVHSYHPGMPPEVVDRWNDNATYPRGASWQQKEQYLKDNILGAHGFGDKKTWVTETGYYVGKIYWDTRTEEIAAAYNIRLMLQNELYGFHHKFFIYNLINEGFDMRDPEDNYGMLCNWTNEEWDNRSAYAAKPQYLAMAQWNKMMAGAEFESVERDYTPGRFKDNDILVTPFDSYNAKFKKGEEIVHVVWDVFDNSEAITVDNTENKKYTVIYDMYGNVTDKLTGVKFYTYDAGKSPVYVLFTDTPEDVAEPEIMFYRDYEDYQGGNNLKTTTSLDEPFNRKGFYGTLKIAGDGSYLTTTTSVNSGDGKGVQFDILTSWNSGLAQITDGGGSLTDLYDGTLYIAYDEIPRDGAQREDIYFTASGADYALSWYPGVKWSPINRNWGSDCTKTEEMAGAGKNHKVELIIDPDTGQVKRFVNGTLLNNIFIKNTGLKEVIFRWADGNIIDNFTIVHYPENVMPQTFSMTKGAVDAEKNTLSVFLKSDASDSDGASGSLIKAPYGVSPESLETSLFNVEGYTVSSVTKGDAGGEYIIWLEEDIVGNEVFIAEYNRNIRDVLGACINPEFDTVAFSDPEFEISDLKTEGNQVSVTYKNTTGQKEEFIIVIASFEGNGALGDVNFKKVVAYNGDYNKEESVSLMSDTTGKTVKAFVIDSFSDLTPIY